MWKNEERNLRHNTGCGAEIVRQGSCTFRYVCLDFIALRHLQISACEEILYFLQKPVVQLQFSTEESCEGLASQVVIGGPQPPGEQNDVGIAAGQIHYAYNEIDLVADGVGTDNGYAD